MPEPVSIIAAAYHEAPNLEQLTRRVMPAISEAVRAYASIGEICDVLREVFGEYRAPAIY